MFKFHIELHNKEYISDYIEKYGCWEPITTEILIELFNEREYDTIFVDIGANIGYFSLLAAQQGVPTIAFEPVAANYALLEKSIDKNNFRNLIQPCMVALSNKREKITINISNFNMGLCSTRKLLPEDFSYSQTSMSETLDDYFGINTHNNLIIKIDVEEHEKKVLQGMEQTLASGKVSHIILEIARHDSEIFDLLRKYNFNYCVNLGYANTRHHIIHNTQYLRTQKYLGTTDFHEKQMKESTDEIKQKMLLFYKTPSPV